MVWGIEVDEEEGGGGLHEGGNRDVGKLWTSWCQEVMSYETCTMLFIQS